MKKLIEFPDEITQVLEEHKNLTGRSVVGMIQEAVYRWMVHEKLIRIKTKIIEIEKNSVKKKTNITPKEVEYCDSAVCDSFKGGKVNG